MDSVNVFFYLTYQDSVDIDALENETLRKALIAQITHFGMSAVTPRTLPCALNPSPLRASHSLMNFRAGSVFFLISVCCPDRPDALTALINSSSSSLLRGGAYQGMLSFSSCTRHPNSHAVYYLDAG